jgi:hypothetical protein
LVSAAVVASQRQDRRDDESVPRHYAASFSISSHPVKASEISLGQHIGPSWSTLGATYKGQVWRLKESGVFHFLVREARPRRLLFGPSPSQFASAVNAIGIEALCAHRTLQSSYDL